MMPVMDGWTFPREQQTTPVVRDVSDGHNQKPRNSEITPVAAFLTMPFEMNDLLTIEQTILSRQSPILTLIA
jgi:CheY-like chemotaxis protein